MKVKVFESVVQPIAAENEGVTLLMGNSVDLYVLFNNQDIFEFVSEPSEADIVPMMYGSELDVNLIFEQCAKHFNKNQVSVNIKLLMHMDEVTMSDAIVFTEHLDSAEHPFKKLIHLHNDIELRDNKDSHHSFVYTDFLFNRSHVLHFNNNLIAEKWPTIRNFNHWYNNFSEEFPESIYSLTPDEDIVPKLNRYRYLYKSRMELTGKIFVTPSMTRRGADVVQYNAMRNVARRELNSFLYDYQGYIGDMTQGTTLIPDYPLEDEFSVLGVRGYGFSPPHNDFYDTSVLSIYIETLLYLDAMKTKLITEKTFTPMCKGHFVIPLGFPGAIELLKQEYKFKLPDWIDYSYDSIPLVPEEGDSVSTKTFLESDRWDSYKSCVKEVLALDPDHLYDLKKSYVNILLHNRSIMRDHGQKYGVHDSVEEIMS